MLRPKQVIFLLLSTVIFATALSSLSQKPHQVKQVPKADYENFPILDYQAEKSADPDIKAKRAAKGKKYNTSYGPKINESFEGVFTAIDWAVDLPALPIDKSEAVVLGQVKKAEAHLSENQTDIYSEFTVAIEAVFKGGKKFSITRFIHCHSTEWRKGAIAIWQGGRFSS